MKHARQHIREATALALAGILPTIHTSRAYPLIDLPAIGVYAAAEASSMENDTLNAPRRYTRRLAVTIEIIVEATAGYDDLADDYAAQVEAAMAADLTLGGAVTDTELKATRVDVDGAAEVPVAKALLTYEAWYRTTADNPEAAL